MQSYDSWLKSEKKCFFKDDKKKKKSKSKYDYDKFGRQLGRTAVAAGGIILLAEGVDALAG